MRTLATQYARRRNQLLWQLLIDDGPFDPAGILTATNQALRADPVSTPGPQTRAGIATSISRYVRFYRPAEGRFIGEAIGADGLVGDLHVRFAWAVGDDVVADQIVASRPWLNMHGAPAREASRLADRGRLKWGAAFAGVRLICLEEVADALWLPAGSERLRPLPSQWSGGGERT